LHPTYIFQQAKIKLHANQQKILLEKGLNVVSPHIATQLYNLSDTVQRFDFKWWCAILDTVRISISCNLPTLLRFQLFILSVHTVFVYILLLQHDCTISVTLSRDLISSDDEQF